MQYFTKEQIEKLPKWARDTITSMQVRLNDLEEYQQTKENAKVVTPHYAEVSQHSPYDTVKHYLPKWATLVAELDCGFRVKMMADYEKENHVRLDIADGVIRPVAGNVIHIHPVYNRVTKEDLFFLPNPYSNRKRVI
jgi:hypothetical protein